VGVHFRQKYVGGGFRKGLVLGVVTLVTTLSNSHCKLHAYTNCFVSIDKFKIHQIFPMVHEVEHEK